MTEDSKYVRCMLCKHDTFGGGKITKTYTTSNLISHLKYKHKVEYEQYNEEKITKDKESLKDIAGTSGPKQLSFAESYDRIVWNINNMIAIDCQLLSIVENRGFKSPFNALEPRYNLPSRHY